MNNFKSSALILLALALGASAFDTTIVYSGGRQFGTFMFDGRSNMASGTRTDVPDTVRLGPGFMLTRLVVKGGSCILSCSYPVQSGIAIQVDSGTAGLRNAPDTAWNDAVSFPTQLTALDSISAMTLSPCFGGGPYGVGFLVSSDDATSVWSGCANVSTFRILSGYNRIVYHRKGDVFLKLQIAGFESDSASCEIVNPPMTCSRGDKIVFRYLITDDSTGYFGTDPISIRSRELSRRHTPVSKFEAWKSDLLRMILGRSPSDGGKR